MLKLLLCEDWLANRDEILKRLARDVAERQGERILLVPELISHDMERRLCRWAGDTASRYAQVLSFTRLAGGWRKVWGLRRRNAWTRADGWWPWPPPCGSFTAS